jgi:hypothetical protein
MHISLFSLHLSPLRCFLCIQLFHSLIFVSRAKMTSKLEWRGYIFTFQAILKDPAVALATNLGRRCTTYLKKRLIPKPLFQNCNTDRLNWTWTYIIV